MVRSVGRESRRSDPFKDPLQSTAIVFTDYTGMNPLADTHRMWLVIILWNVLSNLRNLTPSKMIDCQLQLLQVRACAERRVS